MADKISAGSYELNKWLFGGYEKDVITMIAGPAGAGKTTFCLFAACSQAKRGKKVIYVDTEGGFSVERVKQISGDDYEKVLSNIFLLEPTSFDEQKKVFSTLLSVVKKEHTSLIIVDGISMLYRLELGDAIDFGGDSIRTVNKEVAKQMRVLAEISRKEKIPILITNQVYGKYSKNTDGIFVKVDDVIVGGDLFKYWSKCIIGISKEGNKRRAVLLKHRSLPEKDFGFIIKDKGIYKRGFL